MLRTLLIAAAFLTSYSALFNASCWAEKNVELKPLIAKVASPTLSETFDKKFGEPMQAKRGEWKTVDGVLIGKEIASEKHAGVLHFEKPNRNSVVRFSFKVDGTTKGFHFSLNRKGGHLFRVITTPTQLSISVDKDKKDPESKIVSIGKAKGSFQQGKWYTMQVEMIGDKVAVQTDNGVKVQGQHVKLDVDKPQYRFIVKGETLSLDDLHIWEVK